MIHLKDSNGVEIVKELIKAAQSGGNFVDYVMPKSQGLRPDPKISYAEGIPDWKWYVGAGVYVDEIEKIITQRQIDFRSEILGYRLLSHFVGLFCLRYSARRSSRSNSRINSRHTSNKRPQSVKSYVSWEVL